MSLACALVGGLLVGCSDDGPSDDEVPADTVTEPGVPFDPDVPEGVDTETDEGRNQGFESDEPSGVEPPVGADD